MEVLPATCPRFIAASDAAEDVPGQGTGGFLLVWQDRQPSREALVADATYKAFLPGAIRKLPSSNSRWFSTPSRPEQPPLEDVVAYGTLIMWLRLWH